MLQSQNCCLIVHLDLQINNKLDKKLLEDVTSYYCLKVPIILLIIIAHCVY